jgi:hypothetical protein
LKKRRAYPIVMEYLRGILAALIFPQQQFAEGMQIASEAVVTYGAEN